MAAVKNPFEIDEPLQPVSTLDSMYYGQQQPEQALAPAPQPQPTPPREPVVWDQPRENESWWEGFKRRMREGVQPERVQNRLDTVSLEGGNDILPESTKTISGQAIKTGLQEAAHDVSNVTDPFKVYEKVKIPAELEKQLRKDVVDGWSDPNWWVAQGLYGLAKNAPTLVGMGVGAIVGATPGAAIGGALTAAAQNLQPAYQRAREEGLEHEEAKKRAIAVATVDAAFTASMALAPQLGVTVKALEKPIAQALSQVLLMQGQDLAVRTAEDKGLPTTREAATNLALGTMMAAPMLKAAKIPMLELDPAAIRSGAGTFGGQIFASELAKKGTTKPLETLELAQKLEKQGKSPEDIWQETSRLNMAEDPNNLGWFRGKDGEWRFEVNDQATFNKEGPDVGRLTDSYRNPPVEKAIDLGDITLTRNPKEFGGEYNADFISPEIGVGTRAYTTKTQNPNIFGKEWSPRSVTSHEVQHFIQDVEKWQNGSNPDAILKGYYGPEVEAALKTRQLELYRGALEAEPNAKLAPEEHQRAMLDAARKDAAHELYEKVAGEVEARNVQTRLDMTPEERLAKRPELTEDVPRDQQILDPAEQRVRAKAEPPPIPKEIDQAGYFSGAWEAAKRLPQFKGTPEQMLAQLKKLGTKDNEIKATGLDKFLEGKSSVTKKEIADYLADNRTKLTESVYDTPMRNLGEAMDRGQSFWNNKSPKWSTYSLEPTNPTYKETVLHLPEAKPTFEQYLKALQDRGMAYNEPTPENLARYRENYDAGKWRDIPGMRDFRGNDTNFRSGHWSEPNVVAHIRSSIQHTADGKKVFTLNELQSDWGQKIRDVGAATPEKISALEGRVKEAERNVELLKREGDADYRRALSDRDRLLAELRTAKRSAPPHPLVNTTDQWVNTALRNVIKQAVDAGADHIAIASGKTVKSFGMGGKDEGINYAYDKMYPKNLRNILQKIDPEAAKATTVEKLKSNDGTKDLGQGFTLFPITDKVRQTVTREGQPMFSKHREKTAMEELREKYKAEEKVPEQAVEDVMRRNEEPPIEPPKTPPPTDTARIVPSQPKSDPLTFDKFYTAAKDDLHPIRRMEEKLLDGRRGTLADTDQSPYQLARLTRGLEGRVQQAIQNNMYRFKDMKNVGPGLEKILEPIKMKDREAFEQYLVYKRTLELENRGIKTGFDPRNAADFVRKNAKQFDETAKKVTRFAQQGLEYLRDSGVISKDAYTRMTESNKDYVPFYRLMEDGGDISSLPNTLRNPVKEIKGSERDVISPLESIVRNTYAFIGIAERNRVLNAMKDLADANPAVGKQLMQRMVGKTEMEGLKKAGKDTSDLTVFKPDTFHPAKDEIVLFRNGERQTYKVEPEVAAAVKNLNREELNWVVKAAAMPARWLRAGATLAPEFIARNPIRDQFSATILSNNNYLPLVSLVEGFVHSIMGGKSPQYQAALKGGGFNANLVSLDRKYINDNLMRLQDPTVMGRVKNVIHSPVEALRKMSELMENATRMGEFLQARRAGKSIFNSAYDMREVTLDFARMGAKARAMNAITAFWNANLEGTDRLARAAWENPARTSLKAAAGIMLPSALLWWATRDDERMKEVPKWERDTFWVIPMDDWQPIDADKAATIPKAYKREINGQWFQNKGELIRIPKPFTEGILLGSGTERALEAVYGNDPKAWKQFGKSIWGALTPGVIPTGVLPPLEVAFGRSWFLDRDIVPKYLQRVDLKEQYNPYTSETAKFLGKHISNVDKATIDMDSPLGSPLVLEHLYRGWTGGLGKLALEGFEKGLEKTGITDEKKWPTNKNADVPLLRAFASRHPSSSAESIQQFYDEYEKREKAKNTAKLLNTRGDTDGARKIREERALANATSTHRQIGAMNKEVRRIYDDKKLSPDDKREQIDLLYLKMINLAQKANEMFRSTEKKPQAKPVIEDPFKPKIEDPFKQ